jgi:hypothetical protein
MLKLFAFKELLLKTSNIFWSTVKNEPTKP